MTSLSAVIAVRDEERMLPGCLRLLDFVDEIVVVIDSRTRDATEEVARRFTERVYTRGFDTFSGQKNYAVSRASCDWTLILDADERITPELAREIRSVLAGDPDLDAFRIDIANFFFGSRIRHGDWHSSPTRLIRAGAAEHTGWIHERLDIPQSRVGRLREPLWHFSHRSIIDNLRKSADYIEIQAAEMVETGHPPVRARTLLAVIVRELWRRLVVGRGYRDGMPGLIESLYQPFSMLCLRVKIWELQQSPTLSERYEALERALRAPR